MQCIPARASARPSLARAPGAATRASFIYASAMALQARHRFIVSRLDQAFGIEDEALVEDLVREESMLEKFGTDLTALAAERRFDHVHFDGSHPAPNLPRVGATSLVR